MLVVYASILLVAFGIHLPNISRAPQRDDAGILNILILSTLRTYVYSNQDKASQERGGFHWAQNSLVELISQVELQLTMLRF